ncbi:MULTISPECIES: hypothetical protein [Ferrimonas]|uniref:hypothetical protein n=1 Tax=Ferrimonas TaxID=44011 RepID=UPI00146EE01D|nr:MULTISPECIES: hypothetical protein [Ferrimonas]USD37479.1 hypothetical protein J8Z22_21310 [Ferrimonas sp. SCSIO 43195]
MEFTNFCIMAFAAYLVLKKPEKEKLADRLLFGSIALSFFIWIMMSWGTLMPIGNY